LREPCNSLEQKHGAPEDATAFRTQMYESLADLKGKKANIIGHSRWGEEPQKVSSERKAGLDHIGLSKLKLVTWI